MKKSLLITLSIFLLSLAVFAQNDSKIISKANQAISKGDINGAIALLDKGIEKNENLYETYKMRSSLYAMIGNLKGEFDDLSKAIALKSTEGELFERRARARMFLRQETSLILNDLDSAIANGHKVEKVYALRATFRRQNSDIDGALADYQSAVGLNPDSAASNVGLASIYSYKGDDAQAVLILENFLSKYENSNKKLPVMQGKPVVQADAIVMKDENKNIIVGSNTVIYSDDSNNSAPKTQQEMQKFVEKMEQVKNTSFAYAELALQYEKRGDHQKALETIGKAITIDPNDSNSYGVRGKIRSSMKDYEGGIQDLSFAIRATPLFPNYYVDRGVTLILLNREEEAQKDFDKYLSIMPSANSKTYLEKRIAEAKKMRDENK